VKIFIKENYPFNTVDIYITMDKDGKRYVAEPMNLSFKELVAGSASEATLETDRVIAKELLQGLSTALNQAGYRDNATESFQSELNATRKHLEDIRSLVLRDT